MGGGCSIDEPSRSILYLVCWIMLSGCATRSHAQVQSPAPCGPVPSENQLRWQDMEVYAFLRFSLNTSTSRGATGTRMSTCSTPEILTAPVGPHLQGSGNEGHHHNGEAPRRVFPRSSRYTEYSVKNAPCKKGKGDGFAKWPTPARSMA